MIPFPGPSKRAGWGVPASNNNNNNTTGSTSYQTPTNTADDDAAVVADRNKGRNLTNTGHSPTTNTTTPTNLTMSPRTVPRNDPLIHETHKKRWADYESSEEEDGDDNDDKDLTMENDKDNRHTTTDHVSTQTSGGHTRMSTSFPDIHLDRRVFGANPESRSPSDSRSPLVYPNNHYNNSNSNNNNLSSRSARDGEHRGYSDPRGYHSDSSNNNNNYLSSSIPLDRDWRQEGRYEPPHQPRFGNNSLADRYYAPHQHQ